jgi:hypothetical protein
VSDLSNDDVTSLEYYLTLTHEQSLVGEVDVVNVNDYLTSDILKSFLGTDNKLRIIAMTEEAYYILTEIIFFYDTVTEAELERRTRVIHGDHILKRRTRMERTKEYMFKDLDKWLFDLLRVMKSI